jgi:hypothetical protein
MLVKSAGIRDWKKEGNEAPHRCCPTGDGRVNEVEEVSLLAGAVGDLPSAWKVR